MDKIKDMASKATGKGGSSSGSSGGGSNAVNSGVHKGMSFLHAPPHKSNSIVLSTQTFTDQLYRHRHCRKQYCKSLRRNSATNSAQTDKVGMGDKYDSKINDQADKQIKNQMNK